MLFCNSPQYAYPHYTYAAFSKKDNFRKKGASGGVASAFYESCLKHDFFVMATCFERFSGVKYREISSISDIKWARDSKYVFSDSYEIYKEYERALKDEKKCLFIGLPCQVAGLKLFLSARRINMNKLITVDLICHGTPDWKFLDEHLCYIEKKKKKNIEYIKFRDPKYMYYFRAFAKNNLEVYHSAMHEGDTYYRAFAEGLSFREGCYNCLFARPDRVGDITIGDFSGLGRDVYFPLKNENINLIFVNTIIGKRFLEQIQDIKLYERSFDEAYNADGNSNLRHPTIPHYNRNIFENIYTGTGDFEIAVRKALKKEFDEWNKKKLYVLLKRWLISKIPQSIKDSLRNILK